MFLTSNLKLFLSLKKINDNFLEIHQVSHVSKDPFDQLNSIKGSL